MLKLFRSHLHGANLKKRHKMLAFPPKTMPLNLNLLMPIQQNVILIQSILIIHHQETDIYYRTGEPQGGSRGHLRSGTGAFAAVPVWTQQQRQGESGSKGKGICWHLFFFPPYKNVTTVKWLITLKYLQTSCAVIIKQRRVTFTISLL